MKRIPYHHARPCLARGFFSLAALCMTTGSIAAGLDFDKTFNEQGEPRQMHYQASYKLRGQGHQVEVWRQGNRLLKRRSDDALESFITRPAGEIEWHMVVLDLKRKLRTDIDRTNLYRIGHVTDWFGLSHALARPTTPYRLTKTSVPAPIDAPIAACRWYALTQQAETSHICWSPRLHLPLLITDRHNQAQWRITSVDVKPIPAVIFRIQDQGFIRNQADEDIQAD